MLGCLQCYCLLDSSEGFAQIPCKWGSVRCGVICSCRAIKVVDVSEVIYAVCPRRDPKEVLLMKRQVVPDEITLVVH